MSNHGIGQAVLRLEDQRFLIGKGKYVDDIKLPDMCHAVVVMSPYAHARIISIDIETATSSPGVICVLTGKDVVDDGLGGLPPLFLPEDFGGEKGYRTARPILVNDRVRCIGDRVAIVVAETQAQARDAADLIMVDYDPLPTVSTPDEAAKEDAPQIYEDWPNNICCKVEFGDKAAADAAFVGASHVTTLTIRNNRVSSNSLEARAAIGHYDGATDAYTLYTSSQNPHGVQHMMAAFVFHQPEQKFRVISPDVGGGFGMKTDPYPEDGLVLWASKRCGRPVKWAANRSEALMGDNHGRDQVVHADMALDSDGKVRGIRVNSVHSFGAYAMSATVAPLLFAIRLVPSVYNIKAFYGINRGVFTNTSPTGPYRGAGRPEAAFLIERLMNQAAIELGIDAIEIRRRNLIAPSAFPYTSATGMVYDSGDFPLILNECLAVADWDGFQQRKEHSSKNGKLRGRALSLFIEQAGEAGNFTDQMGIRFEPDDTVSIIAGTHSHGQGHATVFAQLITEWLGVPLGSIRYIQGDTAQVPTGRGTYAARSSMIGSSALKRASEAIIEKATSIAAYLMDTDQSQLVFRDGAFRTDDDDAQLTLLGLTQLLFSTPDLCERFGSTLEAFGTWSSHPPNFPNGCHSCEVEVDPETGVVTVDRYSAVDDIGRVLNPMICEGQVHGGVAQGIGQALLEHVVYDPDSGQLLTGSFMDYGMPRADDMPSFHLRFAEVACKTNLVGVKGVGEAGTIGAPPSVINAILDALRPLGVKDISMPATPNRVWTAIQEAKKA